MFTYNQKLRQRIFRCFEISQTSGLRGLFVSSGHGLSPALAGFRKDARTSQRDVLRSAPILARPPQKQWRTPCPLESTRLFSKPARAGETSEGQNGAKFSRWENFAFSKSRWSEKSNKRGISLVAVVIVMMIVASLALFVASSMSSGNIAAVTDMQAEQAFYIGQAGMECFLERLGQDNNWKNGVSGGGYTDQAFGSGTFSVTYSNNDRNDIDIVATGKVTAWDGNTVQRVMSCHVARASGVMTISLWQESL